MTKRRWLLIGLILLLAVVVAFFLPPVHWRVVGWLKGEAFYQSRPTSYWRREVQSYQRYSELLGWHIAALKSAQQEPAWTGPSWSYELRSWLGIELPMRSSLPEVLDEDPAAVPVLLELLDDESVGWNAAEALKRNYPETAAKAGIK
jgi:hypothetical protein